MARELFGEIRNRKIGYGHRKWYVLPLSIAAHTLIIAILIIIPLVATDVLPPPPFAIAFLVAPASAPTVPPPPPRPREAAVRRLTDPSSTAAPIDAPRTIQPETGLVAVAEDIVGGTEGVPEGIPGGLGDALPPPPPPPPPAPRRVGGDIRTPTKIKDVKPAYPSIAQAARVQGAVIIEATIGADGRVTDLKILRSIPLLDQAALDAVRQWEFTPTLLNGVPVPVIMTVTIVFALQ